MSDEINIKPKLKIKLFILIAAIVIVGLTIVAVVFGVSKTATAKKVEKQLSLGEKYLSELEYEQAIVAYEQALKIDPKNTDAYLGLADVYMAMGDYDKAEAILEEATDVITKNEDKERIKDKENTVAKNREENKEPTPEPTPTPKLTPTPEPTPSPTPNPTPTLTPGLSPEVLDSLKKAEVGEYITFGTYEQDNNPDNRAEPIEWRVLDKQDGKVLVLSKELLDCKMYHEELMDITWESCSLRSWLNEEFYYTAFQEGERNAIEETLLKNSDNSEYGTPGGNDTLDKVFALSLEEVINYFNTAPNALDSEKRARATEYAKTQGGFVYYEADKGWYGTTEYDGNGWWWLRSPGFERCNGAAVSYDGHVNSQGFNSVDFGTFVRPALWIAFSDEAISNR